MGSSLFPLILEGQSGFMDCLCGLPLWTASVDCLYGLQDSPPVTTVTDRPSVCPSGSMDFLCGLPLRTASQSIKPDCPTAPLIFVGIVTPPVCPVNEWVNDLNTRPYKILFNNLIQNSTGWGGGHSKSAGSLGAACRNVANT